MIDRKSPEPRKALVSKDGSIVIRFEDGDTVLVSTFWGETRIKAGLIDD